MLSTNCVPDKCIVNHNEAALRIKTLEKKHCNYLWFSPDWETFRKRESKRFFHCATKSCELRNLNTELLKSWVDVVYVDNCPALKQEAFGFFAKVAKGKPL